MTRMSIWTVYDHPTDFPNNYVAREWIIENGKERPGTNIIIAPDIERLREVLRRGLFHPIPRSENDDPVIVESWI
jgi:hypothetical protein